MKVTRFSSGLIFTDKVPYEHVFIEAPESEAILIFYNKFDHHPEELSCTCCRENYKSKEFDDIESATCSKRRGKISIKEFISNKRVLFIQSKDIKPEWRKNTLS